MTPQAAAGLIDAYFMGNRSDRAALYASLSQLVPGDAPWAPYVRAIQAVGLRASDDVLTALRLSIAGKSADDDGVRAVRAALGEADITKRTALYRAALA